MLFSDRIEIHNPGRLPPPLMLESLRKPHRSVPDNPSLAQAMYYAEYIEQLGTGTLDMIRSCDAANLHEPEFAIAEGFVVTIRRPKDSDNFNEKLISSSDRRSAHEVNPSSPSLP